MYTQEDVRKLFTQRGEIEMVLKVLMGKRNRLMVQPWAGR